MIEKYLGITYLKDGEPEWPDEKLNDWQEKECPKGNHIFDEVVSTDSHYLFCDACGEHKPIGYTELEKKIDETFAQRESFMLGLCALLNLEYELASEEDVLATIKKLRESK